MSDGTQSNSEFLNKASNEGVQAGAIHGDVNVSVNKSATPQEKVEHARRLLGSLLPREAERLLVEAHGAGHRTSESSYYYALALVSHRPVHQIDFRRLEAAFSETPWVGAGDRYNAALSVLRELVVALGLHAQRGVADGTAGIRQAEAKLETLDEALRAQIQKHFGRLIRGGLGDELDEAENRNLREQRDRLIDADRQRRVPLFFLPDVREPVLPVVPPAQLGVGRVALAGLGAILIVIGLRWLGPVLADGGDAAGWLLAALLFVLLGVAGWGDVQTAWRRALRDRNVARHEHNGPVTAVPGQPRGDVAEFSRDLATIYRNAFKLEDPADTEAVQFWRAATSDLAITLANEAVLTYGNNPAGRRRPEQLMWLAALEAEQSRADWDARTFFDYRKARVPVLVLIARYGGLAVAGLTALRLLVGIAGQDPAAVVAGTILALGGCYAFRKGALPIVIDRVVAAVHRQQNEARLDVQKKRYGRWQVILADRPSDENMAAWQEEDVRYVRAHALWLYRLRASDVYTYAVLSEGAPDSQRARYWGYPTRFRHYLVQIFLLTEEGVRHLRVELDFASGQLGREWRRSFGYSAMTSVDAHEMAPRRTEPLPGPGGPGQQAALEPTITFSKQVVVSFNSGQSIEVVADNYARTDGLARSEENGPELLRLAEEASGIDVALRVLEGVAADGSSWFKRERQSYLFDYFDAFHPEFARSGAIQAADGNGTPPRVDVEVISLPDAGDRRVLPATPKTEQA